ncbi:MAG: zinc-dependent alcohol dehydrogenase family protein [Methylococcaceae bacterium]
MPKIVRFHQTGAADVLKIEDLPLTEPGQGEIRIKVEAIGLNRAEVMFRQGQYLENPELPSRIGYEAAGVVDAVGAGVSGFRIGDRVSSIPAFSIGKYGVYGESAIIPAHAVALYPDHLSAIEGTSIWMAYLTAFGALVDIGQLQKEQTILITAASSSVGLAAIQTTKAIGATAIATTRGADKKQFLLDAGADHVVVTNDEDLTERVLAVTSGKGADVIFDPIGGSILDTLGEVAANGGIIFEYGALSSEQTIFPLFAALAKGLTIRGYTLFEITQDAQRLASGKRYVLDGFQSGVLKPIIDRTFPLDAIAEAHRHMESNQQLGKIVVTV